MKFEEALDPFTKLLFKHKVRNNPNKLLIAMKKLSSDSSTGINNSKKLEKSKIIKFDKKDISDISKKAKEIIKEKSKKEINIKPEYKKLDILV